LVFISHCYHESRIGVNFFETQCRPIGLYTAAEMHIFLLEVDLSRLSQSMVRQVSRSYAQRLTPGTMGHIVTTFAATIQCQSSDNSTKSQNQIFITENFL